MLRGIKIGLLALGIVLIWWGPPFVLFKWGQKDVFTNSAFLILYFLTLFSFLIIRRFTSIEIKVLGFTVRADSLGRLFKASSENGKVSIEFHSSDSDECIKILEKASNILKSSGNKD